MVKSTNGENQPPKKKSTQTHFGMGLGLGSIYTGPKSQDPGVLKAQADKAKRDSIIKAASLKKKL